MAFKDILVALPSYPEPTSVSVVDSAVSVAAALGAHLAALSCETHVQIPGHFLAGSLVNIPGIIAGETAKSRKMRKICSPRLIQLRNAPALLVRQSFKNARPSNSRTCWLTMRAFAI